MDETMPELMILTGHDFPWDSPICWEAECRCIYADGSQDQNVQVRRIAAFNAQAARGILQRLMAGFGAIRIQLYHLRGPMTPEQIVQVGQANEQNQTSKIKNQRSEGVPDGTR